MIKTKLKSQRIGYLDSLKGIAIILVIIGHIIQYCILPTNYDDNHVFRYIYSFHMAFFMVLSGFTVKFHFNGWNEILNSITKRAINLLLPFFSWALISYCFFGGPSIGEILLQPDKGLWFLYVLFWIYTLFIIITHIVGNKNRFIVYLILILSYLALSYISRHIRVGGMNLIATHFLNFTFGFILADNKNLLSRLSLKYLFVFLPTYLILGYFWHRTSSQTITDCNVYLYNIAAAIPFKKHMIAISATLSLFIIARKFEKQFKLVKLEKLGKVTLGIYAVHFILIDILQLLPYEAKSILFHSALGYILTFCFILIVSFFVVVALECNRYTALFLLGKKK